jgi:hypothetical protein
VHGPAENIIELSQTEATTMSATDQHLTTPESTVSGKDPVLALLAEISANLKDLNSTLKNHLPDWRD